MTPLSQVDTCKQSTDFSHSSMYQYVQIRGIDCLRNKLSNESKQNHQNNEFSEDMREMCVLLHDELMR